MNKNILIVDDEESIRYSLRAILEDEGYQVFTASDASLAYELLKTEHIDIVFLDIWLGDLAVKENEFSGLDGMEALKRIKDYFVELPVIMISGHGNIETAVQAIKLGASDFIEKPLSLEKVLLVVAKSLEFSQLKTENISLKSKITPKNILGISAQMQKVFSAIEQVSQSDAPVLISGENGTGKELVANAIHSQSSRVNYPFIAVNCAALPDELIENELFGHEKGAFTGADSRQIGKFELANNGTLFLDEVADMSLKTQARILRALQEQSFMRLGGTQNIKVDVRIITASNKNLEEEIQKGNFRSDLYYRLCVFPIHLPRLNERVGDIEFLIYNFLAMSNSKTRPSFSAEAIQALKNYNWQGNVRELKNFIERMCIFYPSKLIQIEDLPAEMKKNTFAKEDNNPLTYSIQNNLDFKAARAHFEGQYILAKLQECNGNISKLADKIGLERSYLHRKLKNI